MEYRLVCSASGAETKKRQNGGTEKVVRSATEWIETVEPIAYGPLALSPDGFAALQVGEFNKLLAGYMRRRQETDRRQSYFTACLMSALSTAPVKPDDIYYGLHPEEKPDLASERDEFLKAMGMPVMKKEDRQ